LDRNAKIDIQEGLLSGRSADELAQQYGATGAVMKTIQGDTQRLLKDSGGDPTKALERLRQYRSMRDYSYAAPIATAGAGGLNAMLSSYTGQNEGY
jgi:hypothetical protein